MSPSARSVGGRRLHLPQLAREGLWSHLSSCGFELAVLLSRRASSAQHRGRARKCRRIVCAAEAGFTAKQLRETCLSAPVSKGCWLQQPVSSRTQATASRPCARRACPQPSSGHLDSTCNTAEADVPISELREAAFEPQELRRYFSVRSLKDDASTAQTSYEVPAWRKLCYPASLAAAAQGWVFLSRRA